MPRNYTPRQCAHCGDGYTGDGLFFCSKRCEGRARTAEADRRSQDLIDTSGSCWLWTGWHDRDGYGRTPHHLKAHRWAYEQASGAPIPHGMLVCHDCPDGDTPGCVRNDEPGIYIIRGIARPRFGHLWLGTSADNTADMILKGRTNYRGMLGSEHPNARLSQCMVLAIRDRHARGERVVDLAREHGVKPPAIQKVVLRKTWRHI